MPSPALRIPLLLQYKPNRLKKCGIGVRYTIICRVKGECFESIYFGVNIDEQEKEKIIQFVRKKLNPHINLYQMRVYADAFKLQPEIINL